MNQMVQKSNLNGKNEITIINSQIVVGKDLHIGNIFNHSQKGTKVTQIPSIWDMIKQEYLARQLNKLVDLFFWDKTKGQLSHYTINDKAFFDVENPCKNADNVIDYCEKISVRLMPIALNTDNFISPINNGSSRNFSFRFDSKCRISFNDFSGLPKSLTLRTHKPKKMDSKWTIQRLNTAEWFEQEHHNMRFNLLFDKNIIQNVFVLQHNYRANPYYYVLIHI